MPLHAAPAAPSAPARRTGRASSSVSRETSGVSLRDRNREEGLTGIGQAVSMFLLMRGEYADAGAIGIHGPKLVHETVALARSNEPVGRVLDMLSQAGPYTGLIFAALPLVAQLAVNHGRIPADKAAGIQGVVSAEVLENKMKAELATMELAALQEQQEAERALSDLRIRQDSMNHQEAAHASA